MSDHSRPGLGTAPVPSAATGSILLAGSASAGHWGCVVEDEDGRAGLYHDALGEFLERGDGDAFGPAEVLSSISRVQETKSTKSARFRGTRRYAFRLTISTGMSHGLLSHVSAHCAAFDGKLLDLSESLRFLSHVTTPGRSQSDHPHQSVCRTRTLPAAKVATTQVSYVEQEVVRRPAAEPSSEVGCCQYPSRCHTCVCAGVRVCVCVPPLRFVHQRSLPQRVWQVVDVGRSKMCGMHEGRGRPTSGTFLSFPAIGSQ